MDQKLLLKKLKLGDELGYEYLFKEYYEQLVFYAVHFLHDFEASKELVQDLFVSLYEKRQALDINQSIKAYLYRAVKNRAYNITSAQQVHEKYTKFVNARGQVHSNSAETEAELNELKVALSSAVEKLPPKCRHIFKLNRYEGLSNAEIADRLKLSKRTVETQITKALKILRLELSPFLTTTAVWVLLLLAI